MKEKEKSGRTDKRYKELKEPCKLAIREERCLGCNRLENPEFTGDKECEYGVF